MELHKAEVAINNGIYAAMAWLLLDLGLLFDQYGAQAFSVLASQPEMVASVIVVIACIVGLFYKSRIAAVTIFVLFLGPLLLRLFQGRVPYDVMLLFSAFLLYFFYASVLGTFSYHHWKTSAQGEKKPDNGSDDP